MANFFKPAAKAKISKEPLTLYVEKLDHNGVGIARWNNKPLFIAGTLPGEKVTVKVIEQKNKYGRAKLLTVKEQSESRALPLCKHFSLCGGCDLQMLSLEGQLLFKEQKIVELFSRSFSAEKIVKTGKVLDLPWHKPIKSEPWHYRRKARIGVQFDKKLQATIGFRQKSTNQLAAVKSCPVLVKPLSDIFTLLNQVVAQLTVKAAIGHIEVIQADVCESELSNNEITPNQLAIIVRQLKPMSNEDIALWLSYAQQNMWHVFIDDGTKQTPLTEKNKTDKNKSILSYSLSNNNKIFFDSSDFIQINHQVNIEMIDQALAWLNIQAEDTVLDLFCGLGNFSLALAQSSKSVVGVEGVQAMVDKAAQNAKSNKVDNCQFYQADLNGMWLQEPWAVTSTYNKVLLDPARAGAEQAVSQVAKLQIPTVLYVSCDPTTLARDSAILVGKGYNIEKISLMDMFSQTKHVETMVLFTL